MEISSELFKKPFDPPPCKKQKILSEEKYLKSLSSIIERDFFPDLDNLKGKLEYSEASDSNYGIHEKSDRNEPQESPSTFDTPVSIHSTASEKNNELCHQSISKKAIKYYLPTLDLSLDKFMSSYTSEDNENFRKIMEDKEKMFKIKNPWLFAAEQHHNSTYAPNLRLPLLDEQEAAKFLAITGMADPLKDTRKRSVENWTYKTFNPVMFVPDGAAESQSQLIESSKVQKQEVKSDNTRFRENPFNEAVSQATMLEASAIQAYKKEGKVGVDGKEIRESPIYNLCPIPSPRPGVDASPLMTWGHIEGTPLQLRGEGSQTPLLRPGSNPAIPSYKIPKVSSRDELLKSMTDKVSETQREKKKKAISAATSKLKSPFGGESTPISSMERLSAMSPAAQRLLTQKLGVRREGSLSASYSPSPLIRSSTAASPSLFKRNPSNRLPKLKRSQTPSLDSGLTDNLLDLPTRKKDEQQPKPNNNLRSKASDFF